MRLGQSEKIHPHALILGIYISFLPCEIIKFSGPWNVSLIFGIFTTLFLILDKSQNQFKKNGIILSSVIYLMYIISTLLFTTHLTFSMNKLSYYLYFFTLMILSSCKKYSADDIQLLTRSMIRCGWCMIIFCLVYGRYAFGGRLTVTYNNFTLDPNYIPFFLFFALFHYLDQYFQTFQLRYAIFTVPFLYVLMMTGSRSSVLAFAVGFSYYFFFVQKIQLKTLMHICMFILTFAMCIFPFIPPSLLSRISIDEILESNGSGRLDMWLYAMEEFMNSSFFRQMFGQGVGTSSLYAVNGMVYHNIFLDALVEFGIVGFSLMLIHYCIFFMKARNSELHYISSVFITCMVMGMFQSSAVQRVVMAIMIMISISPKRMRSSKIIK